MSDLATLEIADPNIGGMVRQVDRRRVRFETVPTINAIRSRAEGRPIYEPKIVLFVRHPGERDETAVMATEAHKYEFEREWRMFEAGQKVDPDGTPLVVLFPDQPHVVAHLRGLHIFTVEMLAECGEEGIRRIGMGARDYVSRAQKLLEASARTAPLHQMEAALRERDEKLAQMQAQLEALMAAPRRGRPRKDAAEGDDE